MKVYLKIGKKEMSGYLNLDPLEGKNIRVLEVDEASCEEILADEILDFIPINHLYVTIQGWVSKLRHNGKIIVGGTDIIEVAKSILDMSLNTIEVNHLIHGKQDNPWGFKSGQTTLNDVVEILRSFGLVINRKLLNGHYFIVEAVRP